MSEKIPFAIQTRTNLKRWFILKVLEQGDDVGLGTVLHEAHDNGGFDVEFTIQGRTYSLDKALDDLEQQFEDKIAEGATAVLRERFGDDFNEAYEKIDEALKQARNHVLSVFGLQSFDDQEDRLVKVCYEGPYQLELSYDELVALDDVLAMAEAVPIKGSVTEPIRKDLRTRLRSYIQQ